MKPGDFTAYWESLDAELALVPARPEVDPLPFRSIPSARLYSVRLTSVGSYRIFGYLSVPDGAGPFPALLETPRYGSATNVAHVNDRQRYVVFTATHRGQRGSDQPYRAAYPGLLTDGVEDPSRYVFRSVVADCLRAAEFLFSLPAVDSSRVAVRGENDLSLLTAARRPGFLAAVPLAMLFYRADELRRSGFAYPLEEFNDYERAHPGVSVGSTLAYFDPLHHAPLVQATTVLGGDRADWRPLVDELGGPVETVELSNRGGTDADRYDAWLAGVLGAEPMSRFVR